MTDEQFKQLMDKLDELKRPPHPGVLGGIPTFPAPQPWDHRTSDPYPYHWREQARD